MFAEATEFAKSIQTLQKDVNKVLKYVEGMWVCGGGWQPS